MTIIADKPTYCDRPGYRVLDLRPDGIDCIPVLGFSDFLAVRQGPDFHCHPGCMEFCLCMKGNLIFDTENREFPFLPGSVFVSAPDEPHHLRNNPSGLAVYRILFKIPRDDERILGLCLRESRWLSRSLCHLPKRLFASSASIKDAFVRLFGIYDKISRKSPSRSVRLRAAAIDLLIAIIDAARRTPRKASGKTLDIARRIREAPEAKYPIEQLARECGVSVSAFANDFKRANGLPLHTYLLNCRINKARTLLVRTKRSVASIGQSLCFCSTQHFARIFRRIVGASPGEYRMRKLAQTRQAAACRHGQSHTARQ